MASAGEWVAMEVRPTGRDFQSNLPGADLENLYALEAGAEAVKLAMRVFWYLDAFPGSVAGDRPTQVGEEGPPPSELDSRRIVLGAG